MRKILDFKGFLFEQEEGPATAKPETDREKQSRIARGIVSNLFGDMPGLTGGSDSLIDEKNPIIKSAGPYTGCGGEAYKINKTGLSVKTLRILLNYVQNLDTSKKYGADYTRTLNDLEQKRSVLIAFRNKIDVKKQNQDKFTDALYLIPQNAKDEDLITPWQITTSPSLAYYGDKPLNPQGTGIKMPGDTLYLIQSHTLGHGTYIMGVEGEPVNVGRYDIGIKTYETYHPVASFKKQNCGMEIHRSSTSSVSPCVGPWSGGCQVFCDINEFNDFIAKAQAQTLNSKRFFYAIVELDMIDAKVWDDALKGLSTEESIAKKDEDKKKAEDKKLADKKTADTKANKAKQDATLAATRKKNKEKRKGEYGV
jgi:hypothetical protein